jgi:hypothetical protein
MNVGENRRESKLGNVEEIAVCLIVPVMGVRHFKRHKFPLQAAPAITTIGAVGLFPLERSKQSGGEDGERVA